MPQGQSLAGKIVSKTNLRKELAARVHVQGNGQATGDISSR